MSGNSIDGAATAGASIVEAEGAEGKIVAGGDAPADRATDDMDDTTVMDGEGRAHTIPRNPNKAVDEETSIGDTPGRTSRIVGG